MENMEALGLFEGKPSALALYQRFEENVLAALGLVHIKTGKTQISFSNRHMFACVLRLQKKKDLPAEYIVVTFGLGRRESSPRIEAAVEPYPNRWTHHLLIQTPQEMNQELMGWMREAYDFSASK